jgi:signal transduction histidine kinase
MANLDARLLRVTGGEVRDETWRTNEPYRPIRCLTATADGSVWIGYSTAGLARLKDGKFKRINEEQGLFDNSICSLMPDNHGWMWIGSDHGIFRASLGDLEAVMDGRSDFLRCISHGKDDALPSLQAYYGYSPGPARTRDGRILIPTRLGLAIARPEFAPTNYVAPPAIIESVQVDAEELAGTAGPRELWPRHRKLEFRYTAPSFLDPERIRFRYRLDGFDAGWVDAGAERVARYPRLPAGEYRFQVQAESHGGTATEPAASFAFRVPPFLWQRWWFLLGAAGALLAGVYWVVRLVAVRRLRAQVARLEQENALQRERARIAQDIHDEFGARMTQISLLAERTQYALAYPAKANDLVGRIAQMSRQGIKSLDEIVWAVNPRNDTLQDLLDYAGQYAVDFLQAAGIRCRVDFPDHPRDRNLPADVRHGLFLAVKEALNNVVKHAGATEVWLRVHEADDTLTWVIEDDGHGFERGPGSPQTDGLRNMQQRLAQFGGRCEVEGRPGQGARVKFELRLPAPYAGPPT